MLSNDWILWEICVCAGVVTAYPEPAVVAVTTVIDAALTVIDNTTPLPAKIYANEGVAQFIFLKGNETPEVTYADRDGKYMGQTGVTLPKV